MKFLRIFCRLLIGALFIFSGYTKAIDPMGSSIIFTEDFHAFGMNFLVPLAGTFGVLLSTAELVLGICLVIGLRMQLTAWGVALFMGFFTIFTFILAVTNLVTDCGCFGEAIKLTNWQTFFKNLFILPFVGVIFWQRKNYKPLSCCMAELITIGCFTLMVLGLTWYSYRHLPLIDFMAYKVGVNIPEAIHMPEDAPVDEYEVVLYYEKGGKTQAFGMENYPKDDTSWHFVKTDSKLIKKGYTPPARDFSIYSSETQSYVTDSILQHPGYLFFLVSPHLEDASLKNISKINAIADYCLVNEGFNFIGLCGSGDEQIEKFALETNVMYPIYNTDEKPLKSMVRSNPGLLLLHNGTILAKWSHFDIPSVEELEQNYIRQSPEEIIVKHQIREKLTTQILLLCFVVLAIALSVCFRAFRKKKEHATTSGLSAEEL